MRIVNNYEYNSIELYFDGKPDEMTRETLKMFKWRWNPKKFYRYNKNTAENKALAESLNKSTDEMKDKKIPESYSEKYEKKLNYQLISSHSLIVYLKQVMKKKKNIESYSTGG